MAATPSPLEHVERPPLPWRDGTLTECGLPTRGHSVITRDAFVAKVRRQGQQRAAMTTCMTCWSTATRWPTWDEDPCQAIARETYGYRTGSRRSTGSDHLRDELRALEALVAAHRDDYDELLAGIKGTTRLDAHRRARARRPGIPAE